MFSLWQAPGSGVSTNRINDPEQLGPSQLGTLPRSPLKLNPGPSTSSGAVSGRCWAPGQSQTVLAVQPLPQAQVYGPSAIMDLLGNCWMGFDLDYLHWISPWPVSCPLNCPISTNLLHDMGFWLSLAVTCGSALLPLLRYWGLCWVFTRLGSCLPSLQAFLNLKYLHLKFSLIKWLMEEAEELSKEWLFPRTTGLGTWCCPGPPSS